MEGVMAVDASSRAANIDRRRAATAGAFISYSREESSGLAVALESGLERFAKPWYRLRAVQVFRDESDLSGQSGLTRHD
jgi:hypothetical protein